MKSYSVLAKAVDNLDAIARHPIDKPNSGFGSDTNQAIFLDKQGRQVEAVVSTG